MLVQSNQVKRHHEQGPQHDAKGRYFLSVDSIPPDVQQFYFLLHHLLPIELFPVLLRILPRTGAIDV